MPNTMYIAMNKDEMKPMLTRLLLFWSHMVVANQKMLVNNPINVQSSCFWFSLSRQSTSCRVQVKRRNQQIITLILNLGFELISYKYMFNVDIAIGAGSPKSEVKCQQR